MAVTRLERKGKRNKVTAKLRKVLIKVNSDVSIKKATSEEKKSLPADLVKGIELREKLSAEAKARAASKEESAK
ncbi:MAG: hypothetical protein ACJAZ3_001289 [Sphingobacteriales bacterium]|jgi:hypothetical protein